LTPRNLPIEASVGFRIRSFAVLASAYGERTEEKERLSRSERETRKIEIFVEPMMLKLATNTSYQIMGEEV
jgi:hypothetical protein